jgi:dTDP-4-dehydrorhamnose 3,5-epimerase
MNVIPTKIAGCHRVQIQLIADSRGSFVPVFDLDVLRTVDPSFRIARGNRSHTSLAGAIRGLHFQREPEAEDKLVQCLRGAIFDVCVDLRPGSPTYSKWVSAELTAENQQLMLIPKGCAHGFQTLVPDCLVEYFLSGRYSPEHEGGLRWDDPALAIAWPLPCSQTSERDQAWPPLGETSRR